MKGTEEEMIVDELTTHEAIELRFKCTGLSNMDGMLGKSDPILSLFVKRPPKYEFEKIGETEEVMNNLNPVFKTAITIDYIFEIMQMIKIVVEDIEDGKRRYMGEAQIPLGSILSRDKKEGDFKIDLQNAQKKSKSAGIVYITAEKGSGKPSHDIEIDLKATQIKNTEWFSKSDPFLRFFRPTTRFIDKRSYEEIPKDDWIQVFQTKHLKDELNPDFPPFVISEEKLCRGNRDSILKVEIWDYSKTGAHDFISRGVWTLNSALQGKLKEIKTSDNNKKFAGCLIFEKIEVREGKSLTDFLRNGLNLFMNYAIDFTASNGDPKDPNSLHHLKQGSLNLYQQAIQSIGTILESYDYDKKYPVYGFGARLPGEETVSHLFSLSKDKKNPYVIGVDGILECYKTTVATVEMFGPTYIAPIIKRGVDALKRIKDTKPMNYLVLVILTDGLIADKQATIDAIVEASDYPASIIIIGIGDEDFTDMKMLDGDGGFLIGRNGVCKRDIVQFVSFKETGNNPTKLAEEVLMEVPDQVIDYYNKRSKNESKK